MGPPGRFDLDQRQAALPMARDQLEPLNSAVGFELFRPEPETAFERA